MLWLGATPFMAIKLPELRVLPIQPWFYLMANFGAFAAAPQLTDVPLAMMAGGL